MDKKNVAIGIIGVGMVGNAVEDYYKARKEFSVLDYDKFKGIGTLKDAAGADYVFLCLPSQTRGDGTQDLDAFGEILPALPDGAKVIIKSTVLPGTTENYQKQYPRLVLFNNPEFLDARTAARDFAKPDLQIVGYTDISQPYADEVMKILPLAPYKATCAARESETVKYFLNTFLATKNTFANQMYDYCAANGIQYDNVKNIVKHSPRIGGEVHLNIFQDGYRGFRGACLPKDVAALIHDAASRQPLKLLELVDSLNRAYVNEKGRDAK